ncbi:E3 ubiquitin-protein ligase BIG BROTHER [Sesamum alatum]|uniref:E3 ubiquitin-protein ligase BIG BROTHER n=1 Tax=Sesamum alatum TaxID=300844 RepID=A0AAE1XRG4_9LAMI|nr:E3 ubiquitin-protein ligase BIG BROTHER [Sesamum alatum]
MEEDRRKRTRRTTLDQLQEERNSVLERIESESESEEDETSASDHSDEDFEYSDDGYFSYSGIQSPGLDFSDDEHDYEFYQEIEEDDVDPDELSYEELIALGEMVGVENTGLPEAEINKHLQPFTCHSTTNLIIDRCVICQVEYEEGEEVVSIQCEHLYHRDCITKWLQMKKICPICNNEVSSNEISNTG